MHTDALFFLTIAIISGGIVFSILLLRHVIVILMWNSLMGSDGWHLKINTLTDHFFVFFWEMSPQVLCSFLDWVICLVATELSLLHTLAAPSMSDVFADMFCSVRAPHAVCLSCSVQSAGFSLLTPLLCRDFEFDAIPFVYFGFCCLCFGVISKNYYQNQSHGVFPLCFTVLGLEPFWVNFWM